MRIPIWSKLRLAPRLAILIVVTAVAAKLLDEALQHVLPPSGFLIVNNEWLVKAGQEAERIANATPTADRLAALSASQCSRWLNYDIASQAPDYPQGDLSRLALTLDQLAVYASGRAITVDDVEDLVADTRERSVFELTDAIGEGRLPAALAAVSSLCDQRQSAIGVIAMLGRHVRQLALVHAGRARGAAKGEMAQIVGAPPFIVDKLTSQARRYAPAALAEASALLSQADRALKGMPLEVARGETWEGATGTAVKALGRQLGERVILERLVTRLCELGGR